MRPILIHLVGNALLLGLGYYWLGLGESRAAMLAWSAAVALVIVAGAAWLYGAAFAGMRSALRHVPTTALVAVIAVAAYFALPAGKWSWVARWIVLPWFFVPLFAGAARHGWRVWQGFRNPRWLAAPLFVFVAVWVPLRLLGWVPNVSSFGMEMTSFVLRATVAYLLFVAAGFAMARLLPTQVAFKIPVSR